METKGIYSKENVKNGAYIFTASKKFVSPKFWGIHEENEKAGCAVIVHNGNALFFYPKDIKDEDVQLFGWGKNQTGKQYKTIDEALTDKNGYDNTVALSNAGSDIAKEVLSLDFLGALNFSFTKYILLLHVGQVLLVLNRS